MPASPLSHVPAPQPTAASWHRPALDPALLDNANDNRPLFPRRNRAKRGLALTGLLDWTYRRQRAHAIIRGPIDKFLWALDQQGMIDRPSDRRQLHIDAAIVHEAVMSLGIEDAALVIEMAATGMWPEPIEDVEPRAYPLEPSDKFDDYGRGVRNGRHIVYLVRAAETVSIPQEEYRMAGRRKVKRAATITMAQVPVEYIPIRWEPELEWEQAQRARLDRWDACSRILDAALAAAPFTDHVLLANDNDAEDVAAAANERDCG